MAALPLGLASGVLDGLAAPFVVGVDAAGVAVGGAVAGGGAVGAGVCGVVGTGVGAGVDAPTTVTVPVIDGWIAQW